MLFSADYIFTVSSPPIKNGIVEVDDGGIILAIYSPEDFKGDKGQIQFHKGLICPGFVNVHCHLELSHLKGKLTEGTGLDNFIKQIEESRGATEKEIFSAIEEAEVEMIKNGIVAVGDISNTAHSFKQKEKKYIYYHTFIELLGFHPDKADKALEIGLSLYKQLQGLGSITLHAPYSASTKLLSKINDWSAEHKGIISMHNQESEDENLLFVEKRGRILERLKQFGIDTDFFEPSGFSSLQSALMQLTKCDKILLVHNTFTSQDDIDWAQQLNKSIYWCFCPNANLYIEKRLPNIPLFVKNNCTICIGTDSLASNWGLSILDELKSIQKLYPQIHLSELITWSTLNGAAFLGIENEIGSIEVGKKPGLNLISNLDGLKLNDVSNVLKLV